MEFFEMKFDESFIGYRLGTSDVGCSSECNKQESDNAKRNIKGCSNNVNIKIDTGYAIKSNVGTNLAKPVGEFNKSRFAK